MTANNSTEWKILPIEHHYAAMAVADGEEAS